jgi:lipoprotein NlpI
MGRKAKADADFAQSLALKPDMRSSLELRVKALQAQQTRRD